MKEGVGIVQESRMARLFDGDEAGARRFALFQAERFQPGSAGIGLQHQAIVSCSKQDTIVIVRGHARLLPQNESARNSFQIARQISFVSPSGKLHYMRHALGVRLF